MAGLGYAGIQKKKAAEAASAKATAEADDSNTVTWQGKNYKYNQNLSNYLLLGVDKRTPAVTRVGKADAGQADALFLLSLNRKTKEMTLISIPRDTMTDVDSFGAAIGICRAANALGKKANVVINEVSASLRPLYNMYIDNPSYPDDLFLTSEQALNLADENSMVVVVDTNRPKMVECEELLYLAKTIVVLDHHRQSSDSIDNALLSYIEPYASSACEMVSEILQYIVDDIQIPNLEASSMYAGIMIDTNSFMNRTGVRTFEAAAFLRRSGADITLVRKMFRDDMEGYRAKAAIISNAEVYQKKFAIATGTDLQVESPTIIGAQAANELLDISEIKASFVLTEYNGKIYVSARSIDEVNVQVIMEKLGGGGHMNASGAQFNHTDMDEAVACLKQVLDNMIKEGDI